MWDFSTLISVIAAIVWASLLGKDIAAALRKVLGAGKKSVIELSECFCIDDTELINMLNNPTSATVSKTFIKRGPEGHNTATYPNAIHDFTASQKIQLEALPVVNRGAPAGVVPRQNPPFGSFG